MKKILSVLLGITLILSLAACARTTAPEVTAAPTTAATAAPTAA